MGFPPRKQTDISQSHCDSEVTEGVTVCRAVAAYRNVVFSSHNDASSRPRSPESQNYLPVGQPVGSSLQ